MTTLKSIFGIEHSIFQKAHPQNNPEMGQIIVFFK